MVCPLSPLFVPLSTQSSCWKMVTLLMQAKSGCWLVTLDPWRIFSCCQRSDVLHRSHLVVLVWDEPSSLAEFDPSSCRLHVNQIAVRVQWHRRVYRFAILVVCKQSNA